MQFGNCSTDTEGRIDTGMWVKGDGLSPFELLVETPQPDGSRIPYPFQAGDAATLELRSLEGTGASFNRAFAVDIATSKVKLVNPGASWTPMTGRTQENVEGFLKIIAAAGSTPGWAKNVYLFTLRTAP